MNKLIRKEVSGRIICLVSLFIILLTASLCDASVYGATDTLAIKVRVVSGDTTPPSITIASPTNGYAFSEGPITISGSVTDSESGLSAFSVNVGGTVYTPVVGADGSFLIPDVAITNGPNNITASALDNSGNTSEKSISVFLGWVLHLQVPYQQMGSYYTGAASSQMVLNFIRNGLAPDLSQQEIYNYGHQYNLPANAAITEMDPKGIQYALGHFDPYDVTDPTGYGNAYHAYNYGIELFDNTKVTEYIRDIMHWMAYPVAIEGWESTDLTAHPNVPPVVPAYGTYNHWIIVNGAAASENPAPQPRTNPWYTPNFTAYGLWLTDPVANGIGQDMYVTAQSAQDVFLKPLVTSDDYNGMYLQIAEPPAVESGAEVSIAKPIVNEETLEIIKISEALKSEIPDGLSDAEKTIEIAKKHLYDAALAVNLKQNVAVSGAELYSPHSVFNNKLSHPQLDWKKIVDPSLLTDDNFVKAFDGSQARCFFKVRRADKESSYYYLIPFDKYVNGQFLTYAAIMLNAADGSFEEASWVETPTRFIQVSKAKAINLASSLNCALRSDKTTAELIWEPTGISHSPFYPYWKVSLGNIAYFVTQNEEIKNAQNQ